MQREGKEEITDKTTKGMRVKEQHQTDSIASGQEKEDGDVRLAEGSLT
jgi:hypothetical protein